MLESQVNVLVTVQPLLTQNSSAHGVILSHDRPTLLKTTFYAHPFFYSSTASDDSEWTTAGCVVLPRPIMVPH